MIGSSIRQKFTAAILLTVMVALIVSASAMVLYNLQNYRDNLFNDLSTQASLLGRAVTPALQFDDPRAGETYLALLEERPNITLAAIYNARGRQLAAYHRSDQGKLPPLPDNDGIRIDGDNLLVFKRIIANGEIVGSVFLQAKYMRSERLLINVGIAVGVFFLAMAVAVLLSLWLQSTITRPILSVTRLAKNIVEQGDYSLRATKISNDEIGYLVDALNTMLEVVEQRKVDLEKTNQHLSNEVEERKQIEHALRQSEQQVRELNVELEQRVKDRTVQLEAANKELEAFSYSVSHDLRSPLRAIDGFSQALLEDYNRLLDDTGKDYLHRVRAAAQRMGLLIDDMLKLSRVSRSNINLQPVNLSEIAEQILQDLRESARERKVRISITSDLIATCDIHLIRIALSNLLGNAWKYTSRKEETRIEFGMRQYRDKAAFFVQDNGIGFDMEYANKLFGAFQRLHTASDFPGTGIGLATVKRVISRHGGDIWAEAKPDRGAIFYFTLPMQPSDLNTSESEGEGYEQQTHSIGGR